MRRITPRTFFFYLSCVGGVAGGLIGMGAAVAASPGGVMAAAAIMGVSALVTVLTERAWPGD
jgi:hypothetical protein